MKRTVVCALLIAAVFAGSSAAAQLTLSWKDNMLAIHGDHIPGGKIEVWYIEAYCRPNSHDADWSKQTVIPHETKLVRASGDGQALELECRLEDGVIVRHTITAHADEVRFHVEANNPADTPSQAHWAQPCIRVGDFTGHPDPPGQQTYAYIKKSFVFLHGELAMMPTKDWATEARYTPGQVWAAPGVAAADVNPRPLNPNTPSNGLIGCFSGEGKYILATVWDPYQELFQGVITCLHSDFRIGGLKPGETKTMRGTIYIVENDLPKLLKRYSEDFPEHVTP